MKLNKKALEEWLDSLIAAREIIVTPFLCKQEKTLYGYMYETTAIGCIDMFGDIKELHLTGYEFIEDMAKTLGVEYKETDDGTDEFPLERSFVYRGIKFYAQAQRGTDD